MRRNQRHPEYRLLAALLCFSLFLGTGAVSSEADKTAAADSDRVTLRELGSVEEPEQFPAEGYIHAEIYSEVSQSGDRFQYKTREAYLPVAVSADQTVYAHLGFLAQKLGMDVAFTERVARLDTFESSILMRLSDAEYTYQNDLYQFSVKGSAAPALFHDDWYVPLDIVLNLTGCQAEYSREDVRGKRILALIKPQRDLEDELVLFYRNRESYPFSYTQLGCSEKIVEKMTQDRKVGQFIYRLGCLKPRELIYSVAFVGNIPTALREKQGKTTWQTFRQKRTGASDEAILEDMYLDTYMECLLQEDEAILQETVEETLDTVDQFVAAAEIFSDADGLTDGELLDGVLASVKDYTQINSQVLEEGVALAGTLDKIYTPVKWITGILFTRYQYENSSRFEVEAARAFLEKGRNLIRLEAESPARIAVAGRVPAALTQDMEQPAEEMREYLGEYQYYQIEQNISAYEKYTTEAEVYSEYYSEHAQGLPAETALTELQKNLDATARYCAENAVTLPYSALGWLNVREALLGAGASKVLGVVSLASSVWELGGKVLCGRRLDAGESFLAGSFGVVYQKDAVKVVLNEIEALRSGWSIGTDRINLRNLLYHGTKACLAARKLGCSACGELMDSATAAEQEALMEEMTGLCARLKRSPWVSYRTPDQYESLIHEIRDHASNVLYNMVELSGQVLDWENDQPAAGVKIGIASEEGALLSETVTDRQGYFSAMVQMELVNLEEDQPVVRPLTLHMDYRTYPQVLESVQVECFHRYEISGLRVGYRKEEKLVYLIGAREEDGKTVVDALEIFLDEDCIYMETPDWNGDVYPTYGPMPGQMRLAADMISLQLKEKLAIHTVYNQALPSDGWISQLFGELYDEYIPEALLQEELRGAEEIQAFIESYCKVNGAYPTFRVSTVNSEIQQIDAVFVAVPDGEGLGVPEG